MSRSSLHQNDVSPTTSTCQDSDGGSEGIILIQPIKEEGNRNRSDFEDEDAMNTSSSGATPSKRNKRKMTEPKRRTTDFSIRTICSNSDDDEDGRSLVAEEKDGKAVLPPQHLLLVTSSLEMMSKSSSLYAGYYPLNVPVIFRSLSSALGSSSIQQQQQQQQQYTSNNIPCRPSSTDSVASVISDNHYQNNNSTAEEILPPIRFRTSSSIATGDRSPPSPSPSSAFDVSPSAELSAQHDVGCSFSNPDGRRPRKNYKNMTKQRRIEANARERSRVHTISAAFESLRRAVPSYSYNQRLSKLAILRIACSYILALARLAELDYSQDQNAMTFSECVDLCTQTIQAEGKAKRRH